MACNRANRTRVHMFALSLRMYRPTLLYGSIDEGKLFLQ